MTVPPDPRISHPSDLLATLMTRTEEGERQGLNRLATLLDHADPVELFVGAVASMMFGPVEELTEATHGTVPVKTEQLAYALYPHFEEPGTARRREEEVASTTLHNRDLRVCQEALEELLQRRALRAYMTFETAEDAIIASIRGRATIVRGNAYPAQTEQRIREVQGRFDHWYAERVGIAPTRAVEALRAVMDGEERAFNEAARPAAAEVASAFETRWHAIRAKPKHARDAEESKFLTQFRTPAAARMAEFASAFGRAAFRHVPVPRPLLDPALTDGEWHALLSLIGLTREARERMQAPVEVRNRPLYVLPDGHVLLVDLSNALDALWEALDAAARRDKPFYDTRYQRHAAHWLEVRLGEHLRCLFPNGEVYRTLDYPDPERGPGATAELDAAVVWGPFLLLVEAKAKQFRLAGQLGDVVRLRTDLRRNVQDAFAQTLRAEKYLESAGRPVFRERETGRSLMLHKARLRRVYLLTVPLHGCATLTTRLAALKPLGLFEGDEYPFALSEGELEILAKLCPGPEVFLHYVEKRIALHRVAPHVSADEVDLLGLYLDTRFVSGQLWDNPDHRMTWFSLDGYSDRIDRWARHHWGGVGEPPEIQLAVPAIIRDVLARLRVWPGDEARWIAFCLLDMSPPALQALARGLELARLQPPEYGGIRRYVSCGDDIVMCVVTAHGYSPEALAANLERRVAIERYRRRVRKAIGFGVAVEDVPPFTIAAWVDREWEPNPELDRLVEQDAFGVPLAGTQMPGRNDPCLCGSRKKFKKCCLAKIERARQGRSGDGRGFSKRLGGS
jgi:hypothetical protein